MKKKIYKTFVRLIVNIVSVIEKVKLYFKKDTWVFVEYVFQTDGGKKPDSFSIYIMKKGKAERHWSRIDWDEHEKVIEVLKSCKGSINLEMQVGMGTSSLFIPKWAKSKIVEELEQIKTANGGRTCLK